MQTTSRGPGGVLEDPVQQLRVAGAVVADQPGGDRGAGRARDLGVVGVAVGIDTDDAVMTSADISTGRWPFSGTVNVGIGLGTGHRLTPV
jgi:hypothetical protein